MEGIVKYFILITGVLFPVILLILNPLVQYHWVLDNLLGLPSLFYLWYFFLGCFCFFAFHKKDAYKVSSALIVSLFVFYGFTLQEKETLQSSETKFIYFSTFQYNMFQKINAIEDAQSIIKEEKPDFLIFQEIDTKMGVTLYDTFKTEYPFSIGRRPTEGFPSQQLFMSKYPIVEQNINEYMNKKHRFISAVVSINKELVYFYIMHPPSPKKKSDWEERNVLLKEADLALMTQPNPFVLIGDLNITLTSNQFKHIFNENVYNFNPLTEGHTWRAWDIPYLSDHVLTNEIDQTLTSKNIFISEKKSYKEKKESDHFPVISKFKLITK